MVQTIQDVTASPHYLHVLSGILHTPQSPKEIKEETPREKRRFEKETTSEQSYYEYPETLLKVIFEGIQSKKEPVSFNETKEYYHAMYPVLSKSSITLLLKEITVCDQNKNIIAIKSKYKDNRGLIRIKIPPKQV